MEENYGLKYKTQNTKMWTRIWGKKGLMHYSEKLEYVYN